ncbi:acetate/propionate family kinase [Patescibacteria group bacterium]
MSILVINSGSTSLKYSVLTEGLEVLSEEKIEEIGTAVPDHKAAFSIMLDELGAAKIKAIGHRIVHGGGKFNEAVVVSPEILAKLKQYNTLAPLHNPAGLAGIEASMESFGPEKPNIAVFDTAFYKDLPEEAYRYAISREIADKYNIRRYGFHGISHQSVMEMAAEKLGKESSELNLLTIHLGGGSSITAIKQGQAIDTSMGFTPLEGLVMMTRCGDIDPAIPEYLMRKAKMTSEEVYSLLNKKSGIIVLADIDTGMRDVLSAAETGNKKAEQALKIYVYRLRKYIGAYLAVLGKIDALVFTGAIGSGSEQIRDMVTKDLNMIAGAQVFAFKSGEAKLIAREALNLLGK